MKSLGRRSRVNSTMNLLKNHLADAQESTCYKEPICRRSRIQNLTFFTQVPSQPPRLPPHPQAAPRMVVANRHRGRLLPPNRVHRDQRLAADRRSHSSAEPPDHQLPGPLLIFSAHSQRPQRLPFRACTIGTVSRSSPQEIARKLWPVRLVRLPARYGRRVQGAVSKQNSNKN